MNQGPSSDDANHSDEERSTRIEQLLFAHLQRRLDGEAVHDNDLVTQHPELMPELGERLQLLREVADQTGL